MKIILQKNYFLTHILKFKKLSNDINDKQIPPCTFPNDSR